MVQIKLIKVLFKLLLVTTLASCVYNEPENFTVGEQVVPPHGFYGFCKENPKDPSCENK